MSQYAIDALWVKTKRIFPILYREAFFLVGENTAEDKFVPLYIKQLKMAKLSVVRVAANLILLPGVLGIWITSKDIGDIRKDVKEYLCTQDQIRLIYILKIEKIPLWGCVQISNSQVEKLKVQK
jgi:hypothetical protein